MRTIKPTPRQNFEAWLLSQGWVKDRFGHYQKTTAAGHKMRVKMQATSCRVEKQVTLANKNEWFRVAGDYYCNIKPTDDGRMLLAGKALGVKNA